VSWGCSWRATRSFASGRAAVSRLYLEGEEITADARSEHPRLPLEVVGFYAEMDRLGPWEPVPILVTMGGAGGAADHSFFVATIDRVRSALDDVGRLGGVYLCNHGAMITTEEPDGEGVFFAAVRDAVGPDVPLVGTLDPHGNVSILGGFAFSDTVKNGLAIVVTGRNDDTAARDLPRDLADQA
jgi:microcystin degradation protein MlrC